MSFLIFYKIKELLVSHSLPFTKSLHDTYCKEFCNFAVTV